jgi:hypothetical protein
MEQPTYPPDGGTCPECNLRMWFVRGAMPYPEVGAHQWCRCGRRWQMVGEQGERVPFTGEPVDQV